MSYAIHTYNQAFHLSFTSCSNSGNLYDWGFYYHVACDTVGNKSFPSYRAAPFKMYLYQNWLEMPYNLQVFLFDPQLDICYLLTPWRIEVFAFLHGERTNNPYICLTFYPEYMLEVSP